MRSPWITRDVGRQPKLSALCEHLGVPFEPSKLHDATYDTRALAMCLQEARTRGLEWTAKQAPPPGKSYRFRWQGQGAGKGYLEMYQHLVYPTLPHPTPLSYPGASATPLALVAPETHEQRVASCMGVPLS